MKYRKAHDTRLEADTHIFNIENKGGVVHAESIDKNGRIVVEYSFPPKKKQKLIADFTEENCPATYLDLADIEGEEWRDVVGYEGYYSISNLGRVRRETKIKKHCILQPRILKQTANKHSSGKKTFKVGLFIDGVQAVKSTAVLVGCAFLGEKKEKQVYSKQNKKWYDCRLSNIVIRPYTESCKLSYELGTSIPTNTNKNKKLTKYVYVRLNDSKEFSRKELIIEYGVKRVSELVVKAIKWNRCFKGSKWERIPIDNN